MKKIVFKFLLVFILATPLIVKAYEKEIVTLNKCIDGDTASFNYNNDIIKVRFLAIDTPESVHPKKEVESFGKEASIFTCSKLTNATKIELEFDDNSSKTDKYDRYLAWIWVDDILLQDTLIKEGLAEVAYLYGDYKYTSILKDHEKIAEYQKIGIWSENKNDEKKEDNNTNYIIIISSLIVIIVCCIFSKSFRKKTTTKIKNKAKRKIKKSLKNV
ncbi:MAG: thermonuclease family protein [Clostridium sp.]|nr:thermonuclease family protein [Clostridium sp.]MCM1443930.1 thermonuclease family protein [Candidatus Amulumruptor caecigallinarius]